MLKEEGRGKKLQWWQNLG